MTITSAASTTSVVRRALAGAGTAGLLALGLSLHGVGTATPEASATPAPVTLAGMTVHAVQEGVSPAPTWCIFGTHHGKGSGCRGGSINDNQRLDNAVDNTLNMYKDAGRCAGEGVVKGTAESLGEGDPTLEGIAANSAADSVECGSETPEGRF
jgi:hypothetical protein